MIHVLLIIVNLVVAISETVMSLEAHPTKTATPKCPSRVYVPRSTVL